tara:strand:+ start:75 stop:335 length:261 start_codon:yes stop_codon:yes gene_type:complete
MLTLPLLALVFTQAAAQPPKLDVVYAATPPDAVHRMLEIADVRADDRLVYLGSGDGRIVIIGRIDGDDMTGLAGPGTVPRWHAVRR